MCGITGMVGRVDRDLLDRMTGTLVHRGPDAGQLHVGDDFGLGHRRLSIIDIEGGAQPMMSEDAQTLISYNGEIYNFEDLRLTLERLGHVFRTRSDTEVLLEGYREWGDGVLDRINGMFAFAVWDAAKQRLLLARDRVGIKPLYWAKLPGEGLAFGSEPKALLEHPDVSRELDPAALDAYLDLLYVPPPLSMFAGIRQLAPGCKVVWQRGELEVSRWWDARPAVDVERSAEAWAEVVAPVLEDAISMRMVSDVPVGAFLSGGLDSSTIVAVLSERGFGPVQTFCVGYGEEGRTYDERDKARKVAEYFGTEHHEIELSIDVLSGLESMVRGFDEPFGSPTAMLSSALSEFTRRHVTVALAGDGGDELFGGYPRYRGMLLSELASRMPGALIDVAARAVEGREAAVARSYRRWARQFLAGVVKPEDERYASWVAYGRPEDRDKLLTKGMRWRIEEAGRVDPVRDDFQRATGRTVERAGYADLHGFLPENVLRCSDRMSMAHSLELRVPFCDHRLVELSSQLPSHHRVGVISSKRILRRIMKGRLPQFVLTRRKLGFNAPLGVWMQKDLDNLVSDWLAPELLERRGTFDPNAVAQLVAQHRAKERDHSLRLWSLIVLEQWVRLYLD